MNVEQLELDGLWRIDAPGFTDDRGGMAKPFDQASFNAVGLPVWNWKQIIQSRTAHAGTVRGIYVQSAPYTEGKLVTCMQGRMYWVVVDLRKGSATLGQWYGLDLEGGTGTSLLIEPGFGHGCMSLSDDVELLLMADSNHSEDHGIGIRWDDPDIGIKWPVDASPKISDAHGAYPSYREFIDQYCGI